LAKIAGDRKQRPLLQQLFQRRLLIFISFTLNQELFALLLKPSSVAAHYPGDVYSLSEPHRYMTASLGMSTDAPQVRTPHQIHQLP